MRKGLVVRVLYLCMKNDNNFEFALHNKKACKYLDKKPDFADWVITTAFYSALHFVRFKIFTITIQKNDKNIKVIEFENFFRISNPLGLSKNGLLSDLVEEFHPEIANDYNKLRYISWSARYNNYKYSGEVSNDAKKRPDKIKSYCPN